MVWSEDDMRSLFGLAFFGFFFEGSRARDLLNITNSEYRFLISTGLKRAQSLSLIILRKSFLCRYCLPVYDSRDID